jgi:FtsH-binding integral membrane protein
VAAALLAFLIPGLYGLAKYRQLPGFHTWSAKAAMACMGVSVLLMFGGLTALPFYFSVGLLGIVCLEETLMVHWLSEPRQDLHTAVAAWRLTRKIPSG